MKRLASYNHNPEPSIKKTKSCQEMPLISLDEWSVVIKYLPVESKLMWSMTSKKNFEWMLDHVKQVLCKHFVETKTKPFSLVNAFRQKNELVLGSEYSQEVKQYCATNNVSLGELSDLIDATQDVKTLFEISNTKLMNSEGKLSPIQVKTVHVQLDDQVSFKDFDISKLKTETITLNGQPNGFAVKGLIFHHNLNPELILKILTNFRDLQVLKIPENFSAKSSKSKTKFSLEKGECFDEKLVKVPILEKLKSLTLVLYYEYYELLLSFLSISPNLEELNFTYESEVDDSFLEVLCQTCPKLKHLSLTCSDAGTTFEAEISDTGIINFLEKQPNLEYLNIENVSRVSGDCFKRLGDFPNLKHFNVGRNSIYIGVVDQDKDIYFGGNPNPNLEYVGIGHSYKFENDQVEKITRSLKFVAPNLKKFDWLSDSPIVNKELAKLFPNISNDE